MLYMKVKIYLVKRLRYEDALVYKEEYQDMFNEYYDYFYTIIDNLKLND